MPTVPIILLGQIAIAAAIIPVAAWIVVARTAIVTVAVAVSDAVIPILVPAAVLTVVFMIPPASVHAIVLVIPVADPVIAVAVPETVIAIPVAETIVAIAIRRVAAQVFAVAGQPSFVLADFPAVLANVPVAETVVPIPEVAAQVFTIAGQPSFILADFTPVLTNIAEAVVSVEAALIHPARALSDFVRAHALEPVDSVSQFLAVDPLLGPAADDLAEAIAKWRTASGRQTEVVQLAEIGSGG
jgi:hypothetical protein